MSVWEVEHARDCAVLATFQKRNLFLKLSRPLIAIAGGQLLDMVRDKLLQLI
ncbi:MAG: hypothetical protein ACR2NN_29120 [Bryobacteraceae bacterium]